MPCKNKRESLTAQLKEDPPVAGFRTLHKGESDQWARTSDWLIGSAGAYDFVPRPSYDGTSSPFVGQGYRTQGQLTQPTLKAMFWLGLAVVVLGYVWFQRGAL